MPSKDLLNLVGDWEGYRVNSVTREPTQGDQPEIIRVRLEPDPDHPLICDACGHPARINLPVSPESLRTRAIPRKNPNPLLG